MTAEPSWREVAEVLAHRMENHAYCLDHSEANAEPDCAFCRDRAAYRVWERKAKVPAPGPYAGEVVSVFAMHREARRKEITDDQS
jgi:hypothetical protein